MQFSKFVLLVLETISRFLSVDVIYHVNACNCSKSMKYLGTYDSSSEMIFKEAL